MRDARWLVAAAAAVALLAACSATEPDPVPNTPTPAAATSDPLPPLDLENVWLPYSFEDSALIDPGWVTAIEYADGVFIGARETNGELEFAAIDVQGETLWTQTRPADSERFALSRDPESGEAIAVLTASEVEDGGTTASAYNLHTGELEWGPVAVPGPHVGPGLIFAEPSADAMGQSGPRSALNPADGNASATETEGTRILGEYDGAVLTVTGDELIASDSTGVELWRLDGPGWQDAVGHDHGDSSLALIDDLLIRVADGEVLADGVQGAAVDVTSRAVVTLGEGTLSSLDAEGSELWTVTVSDETQLLAAGMALLYLREGDSVRVQNVITGQLAVGYDPEGSGTILVPTLITPEGAGLLLHGTRPVIATVPSDP